MWVAKCYKNHPIWGKEFYLWNRKPEKVSEELTDEVKNYFKQITDIIYGK